MPKLQGLCVWLVSVASLALVGCGASDAPDQGGTGGGAGGTASGGAGGGGDCIDFSHAEAVWGPPRDLRIVGAGFEAYEGDTVRLLIITNGEPHYGLAETAITSGAFEVALPGAVGNYTGLGVYVDKGKDDACTLGVDPSWQHYTGGDHGDVRWEFTPSLQPTASDTPCNINGLFDLTKVLPCPS